MATHPVESYLTRVYQIKGSGNASNELSYYSPLEILFNAVGHALKPPVTCVMNVTVRTD